MDGEEADLSVPVQQIDLIRLDLDLSDVGGEGQLADKMFIAVVPDVDLQNRWEKKESTIIKN